jgi:hypothetical protein
MPGPSRLRSSHARNAAQTVTVIRDREWDQRRGQRLREHDGRLIFAGHDDADDRSAGHHDTDVETDDTFFVTFANAALSDKAGPGTIRMTTAAVVPLISIGDRAWSRAAGTAALTFTVTLGSRRPR